MPFALSSRMILKSVWLSAVLRDDVGSSKEMTLALVKKRLGDLHHLLLAGAERPHLVVGREVAAQHA